MSLLIIALWLFQTPRKSSGFPGSAESTPRTTTSKKTNTTTSNHTRHSIFRPDSPLSSVGGDGDSTARGYTPLSTARSTSNSIADRISASVTPRAENGYSPINNQIDTNKSSSGYHHDNQNMTYNSVLEPQPAAQRSPRSSKTQAKASTSSQKDLNAANNMLPQNGASRKPPKLQLRTMQNSYQNPTYNVNKTPVNEVHPSFQQQQRVSKNEAEDYIKQVNMAACVIQNAFRKFVRRCKAVRASEAAMKRLLTQKREHFTQRQEEVVKQTSVNKELERQKAREEKARQARLSAIEVCYICIYIYVIYCHTMSYMSCIYR